MKTAVVYYSQSGNTGYVAKMIAEKIGADLIPLEPESAYPDKGFKKFFWGGKSAVMGDEPALKPVRFDPAEYEQIVFGTPVWAGTFAPPLRTFGGLWRDALRDKKLAFFACMSGAGAGKAAAKFAKFLGVGAFRATLDLVDPKDKPDPANDEKIAAFCNALK